jgi:Skp family chaperone for outer membrane proteins
MIEKMFQGSRKDTVDSEDICHEENTLKSRRRREFNSSQKNETKNIPKNYGKAIQAFIVKHKKLVKSVLEKFKAGTMHAFLEFL